LVGCQTFCEDQSQDGKTPTLTVNFRQSSNEERRLSHFSRASFAQKITLEDHRLAKLSALLKSRPQNRSLLASLGQGLIALLPGAQAVAEKAWSGSTIMFSGICSYQPLQDVAFLEHYLPPQSSGNGLSVVVTQYGQLSRIFITSYEDGCNDLALLATKIKDCHTRFAMIAAMKLN